MAAVFLSTPESVPPCCTGTAGGSKPWGWRGLTERPDWKVSVHIAVPLQALQLLQTRRVPSAHDSRHLVNSSTARTETVTQRQSHRDVTQRGWHTHTHTHTRASRLSASPLCLPARPSVCLPARARVEGDIEGLSVFLPVYSAIHALLLSRFSVGEGRRKIGAPTQVDTPGRQAAAETDL
jgi:hypothetical protein